MTNRMRAGLERWRMNERDAAIKRAVAYLKWEQADAAAWHAYQEHGDRGRYVAARPAPFAEWAKVTDADFRLAREAGAI